MPRFEYKLVPAPEKATKHKGLKGAANFAATLEDILNELGSEGWHYLRADTLPQEERAGLTSRTTTYRNLLVFQRELPEPAHEPEPAVPVETARPAAPPQTRHAPEKDDEDEDEASLANLFTDPDDTPETSTR
jgi:hypothetical protein